MIQGGGFLPGMKQKTTRATIKNESANGLSNTRGAVAMARTSDPHSASSQFFINLVDNRSPLDGKYAVFGKVISGMDVVNSFKNIPVYPVPPQGVCCQPKTPVFLTNVTISNNP